MSKRIVRIIGAEFSRSTPGEKPLIGLALPEPEHEKGEVHGDEDEGKKEIDIKTIMLDWAILLSKLFVSIGKQATVACMRYEE